MYTAPMTVSQKMSEAFAQIGVVIPSSVIETAARRAGVVLVDAPANVARNVEHHLAQHAAISKKANL
jgi:hypothetical protein